MCSQFIWEVGKWERERSESRKEANLIEYVKEGLLGLSVGGGPLRSCVE